MVSVAADIKLPTLHDALLSTIEAFINQPDSLGTTAEEYLGNFHYRFWNSDDPNAMSELQPVFDLLLKEELRQVTDRNLALANRVVDLRKHSLELAITEYLNDFLNYLIPRIVNLDDWKIGFHKGYQQFEADFISDNYTVEFFGHLGNVSYDFSHTGELNEQTRVVDLTTFGAATKHEDPCNKRADFFRLQAALSSCFPETDDRWKHHPTFLHYRKSFPKTETCLSFSAYELMRKFVLALRILSPSPGKPFCDFVVAFHQGRLSGSRPFQAVHFPEDRIDEKGWVSFEWPNWLRRLWEKLEAVNYTERLLALDQHIDDGLRRGARSARNPYSRRLKIIDELERLSDHFSAFDSVYNLPKSDRNKGKSISNLTAQLVTHQWNKRSIEEESREEVHKKIYELYQVRNGYEHGKVAGVLVEESNPEDFAKRVRMVEYYLKHVAMIYIMNDDFDVRVAQIVQGNCSGLNSVY